MTWLPLDRYAAPRYGAAVLAVAIALGVGVALIATSGGTAPRAKVARASATKAAGAQFPRSPAGAVAAATAWCQRMGESFFSGTWERTVSPMATAAFRARLGQMQRASALVHTRIGALHTPFATRWWPLGYAVEHYSPTTAQVLVWELFVLGISGPFAQTTFDAVTVSLQWTDGDWKVANMPAFENLAPPGSNASAGRVANWVTAVDQLNHYSYVP